MSHSHPKAKSIRVLLVDDHAMIRQGLRCALECYPSIEVVGEAGDGKEALGCVAKVQPTVVVMDIVMPKMDGIEATRLIKTQYPHIAIIGLTRDLKDYTLYSMKKVGATEVVDKQNAVVELYDAIKRAVTGIDGKPLDRLEIDPGLGSMTEATWLSMPKDLRLWQPTYTTADGLLKARPPAIVNKKGGRPMLNNPIVGSPRTGQRRDQPQSGKHVCIFELERKGAVLTAEVICTVCGAYLSSQQDRLPRAR